MLEIVGWIGSFLFGICGLPLALQSIREGHSRGLNWPFIACWLGGEICTIAYVFPKEDLPLLTNYFVNVAFLLIVIRFKIWERKNGIAAEKRRLIKARL